MAFDRQVNRRVLSAYLRKRGCEFVEAGNGEEGVEAFKRYPTGYFEFVPLHGVSRIGTDH